MAEEDKGFRVIDRRASAQQDAPQAKDEKKAGGATPKAAHEPVTRGEGFVMEDKPEAKESGRATQPDQIDFSTLVFSLATGALIHLGLTPDPSTQKTEKNLPLAKQNIDILSILRDKTKGNLSPEEDKLLENLLTEVRLRYVEASR